MLSRPWAFARRMALVAVVVSLVVTGVTTAAPAQAGAPTHDCATLNSPQAAKDAYPVFDTDKYQIVFLDGCALQVNWESSYRGTDMSLWQPKLIVWQAFSTKDGWRTPGDLPVPAPAGSDYKLDPPENYATFLIRDKTSGNIVNPVDYTKVWTDSGGKDNAGNTPIALYEPNCPAGYDALGLISAPLTSYSGDTEKDITAGDGGNGNGCFNRSLTYPMEPARTGSYLGDKGAMWTTEGDKRGSQTKTVAFYAVQRPAGQANLTNTAVLPPPTFWAKKDSSDPPPTSQFRGLEMPLKATSTTPSPLKPPELTAASALSLVPQTQHDHMTVSALLMNDKNNYSSDLAKFRDSPTYNVEMDTVWTPVNAGTSCDAKGKDCVVTHAEEKNQSETTTWNNTVGVAVTATTTATVGVSAVAASAEVSVSLSLEVSYSHEFGGQSSSGTSVTNTVEGTIRPGEYGVYFQAKTTYTVYRHNSTNDNDRVRPPEVVQNGPIALAVYRPHPPASATSLPTTAIEALPQGEQAFTESGDHYLLLTSGGTLEVRDSDQGVEQPDGYLWSLDKNHKYGRYGNPISSVSFADGRLRVVAPGLPDWCSTKATHARATLDIDDNGVLRILDADNPKKSYWTSKFDSDKEGGC